MEEGGGLEPPRVLPLTVFKTAAGSPELGLSFHASSLHSYSGIVVLAGVEPATIPYEGSEIPFHYSTLTMVAGVRIELTIQRLMRPFSLPRLVPDKERRRSAN